MPCIGTLLLTNRRAFGTVMPGRFYSSPSAAFDLGGKDAVAAGSAAPEETALFLRICGCTSLITDGPAPRGWKEESRLTVFFSEPGHILPLPKILMPGGEVLQLTEELSPWDAASFLSENEGSDRDGLYAELCAKKNRGLCRMWGYLLDGRLVSFCAVTGVTSAAGYMSCGCTAAALRGMGVGGNIIVRAANAVTASGRRAEFLCGEERVHFYERLGFTRGGTMHRYCLSKE